MKLNEKTKEPNYQDWAYHLRLLIKIDGNSRDDIFAVVEWLFTSGDNQAQFWRKQIRSTANLRNHFVKLWGHCKGKEGQVKQYADMTEAEKRLKKAKYGWQEYGVWTDVNGQRQQCEPYLEE